MSTYDELNNYSELDADSGDLDSTLSLRPQDSTTSISFTLKAASSLTSEQFIYKAVSAYDKSTIPYDRVLHVTLYRCFLTD